MPSDPVILAFDTTAAHCAAALLCGDRVLLSHAEEMGRGQAERLIPLLEEVLSKADLTWHDLDALAVGVGPGNFTGIRISVSAARGLALGLNIPAVGVSGFDAIAQISDDLPAIPGPRGKLYVGQTTPDLIEAEELTVPVALPPAPADFAVAIAKAAQQRLAQGGTIPAPAPLYIKPADAAPSKDAPPVILDDV